MRRNSIIGIAVGVVALVVGGWAIRGTLTATVTVAHAKQSGDWCRVYVELVKDSIRPIRGATHVAFTVRDIETGEEMAVLYQSDSSALPANFPAAKHVMAAGMFDPLTRKFATNSVQTKCPSKYEAEQLDLSDKSAIDKWQAELARSASGPSSGDSS